MAEVYILDEYEYFDIRREIEAAETHEELRAAVLKLLECLPVRYTAWRRY